MLFEICIVVIIVAMCYYVKCPCGCGKPIVSALLNHGSGVMASPTESMSDRVQINQTRRVRLHYTEWCHYCKLMKPVWARVKEATRGSNIIFEEIDEDKTRTPGITGFPTIIMVNTNGQTMQYPYGADFETLRAWIMQPLAAAL